MLLQAWEWRIHIPMNGAKMGFIGDLRDYTEAKLLKAKEGDCVRSPARQQKALARVVQDPARIWTRAAASLHA